MEWFMTKRFSEFQIGELVDISRLFVLFPS